MSQHDVTLLLGSNLGDTKKNIEIALNLLEKSGCKIQKKSIFLISEAEEFVSSNIFCNIATSIKTDFSPIQLLKEIKHIELLIGRNEDSSVSGIYEDRVIDIDIVSYNNIIFKSKKLKIPHIKHLFKRDFSKKLINNLGK